MSRRAICILILILMIGGLANGEGNSGAQEGIKVSENTGLLINTNPFYIRSRNHLELQGEFRITAYTAGEE